MAIEVSQERIESEALSGLRGLAALHIVVFHNLLYTSLRIIISGSLEMPLFFLLSGYSLTLGYGRSTYDGHTKYCCCNTRSQEEGEVRLFKTFDFFRNRFARLMPMYYFANFVLGLPLCVIGRCPPVPSIPTFVIFLLWGIDSIFPIGMILPAILWPFVGAGWTISTMWCFYLFFPLLLPKLQRYSNEKGTRWIVYCFWIQMIIGILFGVVPRYIVNNGIVGWFSYWCSTGWGISRLPVFIMGIISALLRLRNHSNIGIGNRSFFVRYIYSFLPWVGTHIKPLTSESAVTESDAMATKKKCGRLVDIISLTHIICCLLISPLLSAYANPPWHDILNWALQLLCVNSLLTVIDGLTRDGGSSILSKACRSRPLQQLGRCSMALYLIHEPLRQWGIAITGWCTNSKIPNNKTPLWLIPIVIVVSIVIAWILTVFLEEPLKKRLRTPVNATRTNTGTMVAHSENSGFETVTEGSNFKFTKTTSME